MSKTADKFSPEVRERAVRMVFDNAGPHGSREQAITSIAAKIGCSANTLNDWVKKAEVDSGKHAGHSDDQRLLQSRGHPSSRPLARLRSGGVCRARMGGLVHLLEPIGNIPPAEAEANLYAALETEPMAA